MRAVITGATGCVGMALIDELSKSGTEMLVLCRESSARAENIKESSFLTKANCSLEEMRYFPFDTHESYDVFFHLAWEGTTGRSRDDLYLQSKNIEHTLDAVDLAARLGCKCFVGAGSQAEYGLVNGKINGKTPTFPQTAYGISKLAAGQLSREFCKELGLRHVWARILSAYGPYDRLDSMVMSTIVELKKGNIPSFTAGEQIWDYIYSSDAARALISLAEKGKNRKTYCVGSGVGLPLKNYITKIRDVVAQDMPLGIGDIPYSDGQVMNLCADVSELEADTGFSPQVDFEDGIRRCVEWIDRNVRIETE